MRSLAQASLETLCNARMLPTGLSGSSRRRRTMAFLLLIMALAAALRVYGIGREPLWIDEAASLGFARLPLAQLWVRGPEMNPPLYYTLQKLPLLFGSSEATLRMLPAFIGICCVPLTFCLGRLLGGSRCGLMAAVLLATSPLQIEYSQEARGYVLLMASMLVLVCSAATLFVVYDPQNKTNAGFFGPRMAWAGYVLGELVSVYTHNTAVIGCAIVNAFLLAAWLTRFHGASRFFKHLLTANSVVLLGWAWWLPALIGQSMYELKDFWIWPPNALQAFGMAADVYGQMYFPKNGSIFTVAFVMLGFTGLWRLWRRQRWLAALLGSIVVLVPLLTYLASLYRPILLLRTIVWPLPLFLILVAVAASSIRPHRVAAVVLALLLCIQATGAVNYFSQSVKGEPWDSIVHYIAQNSTEDATVVFCAADAAIPFSYYAARFGLPIKRLGIADVDEPEYRRGLVNILAPDLPVINPQLLSVATAGFRQVWLINRNCPDLNGITSILASTRDGSSPRSFGTIRVSYFVNLGTAKHP